jgi:periplasmic copper chaperone A
MFTLSALTLERVYCLYGEIPMLKKVLITLALLLAGSAQAHDYKLAALNIQHPWARATPPAAATGGGFMKIINNGPADRLVSAEADIADHVELHTMTMEGNLMRMRKLDNGIELPAGTQVELKPGGLHIMFIDLKAPLHQGDHFPLKLHFERAGDITVDVHIEALGTAAMPMEHHMP